MMALSVSDVIKNIEFRREYLPTYEDLDGAAAALLRLQDTYKLDTAELASGNVAGTMTSELSGTARVVFLTSLIFLCS